MPTTERDWDLLSDAKKKFQSSDEVDGHANSFALVEISIGFPKSFNPLTR